LITTIYEHSTGWFWNDKERKQNQKFSISACI